jgi:riboflavin synthase
MFTGIIEEIGEVQKVARSGNITLLAVKASKVFQDANIGDSICVNGSCLTVVKKEADIASFEVMNETLKVTGLGLLRTGAKVNLERSLKIGDRLSGHFVSGHIDCVGVIVSRRMREGNLCYEVALPAKFMGYIAPKGSVALEGVSLTVVNKAGNSFSVYIIPHTLGSTILGTKMPSSKVNVELDILAKYAKGAIY